MLFLLLLAGSLLPAAYAQSQLNLSGYTLMATDDFNYVNVSQPVTGGMWHALPEVPVGTYNGYSKTLALDYELATSNISFQNGILQLAARPAAARGKVYVGSALLMALDIEPQAGPPQIKLTNHAGYLLREARAISICRSRVWVTRPASSSSDRR